MAQQNIRIGSAPNDKTGDPLRTAFTKVNANFTELYTRGTTTDRLTNGSNNLILGSDGNLTLPGGGTITSALGVPQEGLWLGYNGHRLLLNSDGQFWTGGVYVGGNGLPGYVGSYGNITLNANLGTGLEKQWVFGTNGSLQFPDATNQTTASLPYVKTAYNVVNATATMDTITVSWIFAGSGNHVQYSTLSSSNVTYAYSGMNIIAGVTTSFNSAGTYVMNAANYPNPPWFYGIFNTIGDVQIVYMQDITNSKTYRITATATSTYTGAAARGSILIERII